MIRLLPWLLTIALTIYAVVDCVQTNDRDVRGLPKVVWVVLILLFPLVASIAWLMAGRPQRPRPGRGGPTHPSGAPRGPDDGPDFLRRL
jgi:hypothetical protein